VPEVISDTSPVQYLHQTRHLDLLPTLYGKITIPQAVVAELQEGIALGVDLLDVSALSWIEIKDATQSLSTLPVTQGLGTGEREVLALALQTTDSVALLDDLLAREYAKQFGVLFTGTLGILLKAKQLGHLIAIALVLDQLDQLSFRLAPTTRAAVLKLAGE
jgi:predicted nucleic acid-binding protein